MKNINIEEVKRYLKRSLKKKVKITTSLIVLFMMSNSIGMAAYITVDDGKIGSWGKNNSSRGSIALNPKTEKDSAVQHQVVKDYSIAIGLGAEANASDSVSIGHGSKGNAVNSVAIGKEAEVTSGENDAIAIGYQARVMQSDKTGANGDAGSIAIGKNARTWLIKSTAIGIDSEVVALNTFDKSSASGGGQGLAIGSGSKAVDQATSLGNETYAIGRSSIAIGSDDNDRFQEKITKEDFNHYFKKLYKVIDSTGSGYGYDENGIVRAPNKFRYSPTLAAGEGGIAFGTRALSYGVGATSIGAFSYALGDYSTAMGAKTRAEGNGAIAIGNETKVFSDNSVAVGNKNEVSENGGMAYGYNAISSGKNTIAIGSNVYGNVNIKTDVNSGVHKQYNDVNNDNITVSTIDTDFENENLEKTLGKLETLYKDSLSYTTPALVDKKLKFDGKVESTGKQVKPSNGNNAIVVGTDSVAKGENSITFGHAAFGMKNNTVSIGSYTYVNGKNSLGLGIASRVFSDNSLSIGVGSVVTHNANNSLIFGNSSVVKAKNSLAIGNYSKAELENSISIGNHSNTDYNPEWLEEPGYAPKGAISTLTSKGIGVVSIGTIGKERRLTNLASGYRDTDAVNVSQLRSLEEKLSTVNPDEEDTSMMNYLSVDKNNKSGEGYKSKEIAMKEVYYKEYIKLKAKDLEMQVRKERNDEKFKDEYINKIKNRIKELEKKGIDAINKAKTDAYGTYTEAYIKNNAKTVDTILKEISDSKDKALAKKQNEILSDEEIKKVKASNYNNDGAKGADSIALGYGANANGNQAVAIGKNAEGKGNQSVVIGTPNSSNSKKDEDTDSNIGEISAGESSVSVGNGVKSGNYSVGIGGNVVAGETAVAIGDRARAIGKFGIAIGEKAKVEKENGIAFGNIATSTEKNAIAIGNSSKATKENAIALGQGAKSEQNDSVAIGNGSEANSSTAKAYLTDDQNSGGRTFAVGGTNIKRRITGVADGSADSDAVTVAQLKKLSEKGITFKDDKDTKTTVGLAGEIKISGKEENNHRNISVTTNNKNLEVALSKTLKGITSIENGDNSAKLTLNKDNITINSKKVTGLVNGSDDTDAVAYGQVKNPFKVVADNSATGLDQALGKKIEITGRKVTNNVISSDAWSVTGNNNPKNGRYTTENVETFVSSSSEGTKVLVGLREDPTFKKITLKDGDTKQVELTPTTDSLTLNSKKISGLSNGTNDTDAVAYGQVKNPFKVVADNNANGLDQALGKKIEITGRKSITDGTSEAWDVKDNNPKKGRYTTENVETFVRTSGEGTQVLVGLREDPTFKKVTAGGENKTEITDSGINITKKVTEKNNKVDKVVKFGIDDKGNATLTDARNNTASQIVTEKTLGDQKIKYAATNGNVTTNPKKEITLTNGFNFSGGTNTEAEVGENGVVKFNLKNELTGITSIEKGTNGAKIILKDDSITVNKKITGLADGDINDKSTDAVNGKQLNTVKTTADEAKSTADTVSGKITALEGKKLGFTGNSGNKIEKKLGEDIAIKGDDSSITTEAGNNAITITVKDNGITSAKIADKTITEGKLDDGLLTKINAGNTVATNTITLSGDNGADNNPTKTSAVKLNKNGGIEFSITGKDGFKTTASGTKVEIGMTENLKNKIAKLDNLAENAGNTYAAKSELADKANKTLDNIDDTGINKIKDTARESITVKSGTKISVTESEDKTTHKTTYTVALDKDTVSTLNNIGKISDGKDGKNGTAGAGSHGLTGQDGLNGKDLTTKVNALRNGEAGTVVFTNKDGERLIKGNDGKYYKPEQLDDKGDVKADAKDKGVENPELRVVNANGETTKATTLNNLASALSNRDADKAITVEKAKGVVATLLTKIDGLDKAVNLADLQAIAQAGLDFSGNAGTSHQALGTTLNIKGKEGVTYNEDYTSDNVATKVTNGNIEIGFKKSPTFTKVTADEVETGKAKIKDELTFDKGDGKPTTIVAGDGNGSLLVNGKKVATSDSAPVLYTDDQGNIVEKGLDNKIYKTADLKDKKFDKASGKYYNKDQFDSTGKLNAGATEATLTPVDADKVRHTLASLTDGSVKDAKVLDKVADGKIDTNSKEAINGSQIKTVLDKLGVKIKNGTIEAPTITTLKGADGKDGETKTTLVDGLNEVISRVNSGIKYNADLGTEGTQQLGSVLNVNKATNTLTNTEGTNNINYVGDNLITKYTKNDTDGSGKLEIGFKESPTFKDLTAANGNFTNLKVKEKIVTKEIEFKDAVGNSLTLVSGQDGNLYINGVSVPTAASAPVLYTNKKGERVELAQDGNVYKPEDIKNLTYVKSKGTQAAGFYAEDQFEKDTEGHIKRDEHGNKILKEGAKATDVSSKVYSDEVVHRLSPIKKDKDTTSKLTNLADGDVTETSTDAINGKQFYTLSTNTIKLTADGVTEKSGVKKDDATDAKLLNTSGGISFGIKGADGIETTAKGTDVTVKLKAAYKNKLENLADNANDKYAYKDATNLTGLTDDEKAKWREAIGLGNAVSGTGILSIDAFTTKGTTEESTGTSKVKLDGKENFKLVGKDGITVESDSDKKLTFGLDQATKDKLSNITKVSDGKDGKNGTDGTTTAGIHGLTGKDGLNGKNLTDKVNALRNGEAGTVVYTDSEGNRLVKANDGKYYRPEEIKDDGTVKTKKENNNKEPKGYDNPELRVVNAKGETTKATTLNNLASALSNRDADKAITAEKAKGVVDTLLTKTDGLDKAVNLADLQAIAQAGLDFSGNTGELHRALGTKLQIVGEGTPATDFGGASDNINVKAIEDATNKISKLEIQLAKALKNIESIQNEDTKITLDKDKGVAINGKDGGILVVKGKDDKDGVSIKGGDGTNAPTIAFNKTTDNKGTGTITGLKDFNVNDKDYGKNDSGIAATQKEVKDVLNKINANGTEQSKLKNGTLGTVVYTDKDGNKLMKDTDGKFYKAKSDGTKEKNAKEVVSENVILSTVNPDGETTKPITLGNVASALGLSNDSKNNEILNKLINKEAKKDLKYTEVELNKVVTLRDLQFLASKGITFAGSIGTANKYLGDTITINGTASNYNGLDNNNFANKYETKNIAVKVDNKTGDIEVGLAKELSKINSITSEEDTTDKTKTKITLSKDGATFGVEKDDNTQVGAKTTIGKDGISLTKQGEQDPSVSIKSGDTKNGPSIDFATKEEVQGNDKKTVGTGSITGLKDLDDKSDGHMAANKNYVDEKVKTITGDIDKLKKKGLKFAGNTGETNELNDKVNIKGEGAIDNNFESAAGNINVVANASGVELKLSANLKNMKSFKTENDKDGNSTKLDQKGLTITDKDDKNNSGTKDNPRNTVEITKDKIVFKKEYKDGNENKSDNGIVIDNSKGTISGVKDGTTSDSVVTKGYIDNKLKSLDGNKPFEYYEKNKDTVFGKDGTEYKAGTIVSEDGKVYAEGTQEVEGKYFDKGDKVVKAKDGKFYKEKDIKDRTYDEATKKWSGDSVQPTEATEAKALEGEALKNAKAEDKVLVKGKDNKFYDASDFEKAEYDETSKKYKDKNGKELTGKEAKDVVIKALPNNEAMTLSNIANARLVKDSKDAVNAGQMLEELDKKMNKDGSNIDKKGFANNMSKGANIEKPEGILVTDKQVNEHLNKNYYNKTQVNNMISTIDNKSTVALEKSELALGGVANAVAMANLVQVNSYSRHRHNLSAAYGYYGGSHALAVGFSGTNEERNFVYKLSGSVNNKGNLAFGVGAGVMLGEEHDTFPSIDNKKIKEVTKKLDEANKKISEYEDDKKQTAKKFKELEDKYENDKKESNKKLQEMERKLEMLMKKFK